MAAALGWGLLAASSLVLGAVIALRFRISLPTIGLIMAFGAGVLISAVSFDLVEEAVDTETGHWAVLTGIFAGCGVFFGGDWLIDRMGGADRKDADGDQATGSPLAIVLGTVLDGIPESMVIGLTIFQGGAVGARLPRRGLHLQPAGGRLLDGGHTASGWKRARILWMWIGITVVSGLASLAGYGSGRRDDARIRRCIRGAYARLNSGALCDRQSLPGGAETRIRRQRCGPLIQAGRRMGLGRAAGRPLRPRRHGRKRYDFYRDDSIDVIAVRRSNEFPSHLPALLHDGASS
jgi:zinc transporter, ZIP family